MLFTSQGVQDSWLSNCGLTLLLPITTSLLNKYSNQAENSQPVPLRKPHPLALVPSAGLKEFGVSTELELSTCSPALGKERTYSTWFHCG